MAVALPDQHCTLQGSQLHSIYTCTLNRVDIGKNENKFYIIQLLSRNGSYYVWTRWGRVGIAGQSSLSSPGDESSMTRQFRNVFKNKTGLDWDSKTNEPIPGHYTYMRLDAQNTTSSVSGQAVVSGVQGAQTTLALTDPNLDDRVAKVVHTICDKQLMTQAMVSYSIDVQKLPLGKLSREQLDDADKILKAIDDTLRSGNASKSHLEQLSSRFWTLVPQASKLTQRLPVISTLEEVHRWADILDGLRNIQSAVGAMQSSTTLHQLYTSLGVDLSPCDASGKEMLQLMLHGTTSNHGMSLELQDAFVIDKKSQDAGDASRVFASLADHRLLFHGTKSSNIAGILKDGFRVPRPDQVVNGAALGRGIYYADCCTKSAQYCGLGNGDVGFMFVCEVALGTKQVVHGAHFDSVRPPFQSRVAKGKMTVNYVEVDGIWYPSGPVLLKRTNEPTTFAHNEIVVNNVDQYRFRYLLVIKRCPARY